MLMKEVSHAKEKEGSEGELALAGTPKHFGLSGVAGAWLTIYVLSGVACGALFEFLVIHAGPARYDTFFLALLGYSAQALVGAVWLLASGSWRTKHTEWNRPMLLALLLSAILDGAAQGLYYIAQVSAIVPPSAALFRPIFFSCPSAQVQGGLMLFTIFSSSVTLFACILAVVFFGVRLQLMQWGGVGIIGVGLLLTSIPNPIVAQHSFFWGATCSLLGAMCSASAYPISVWPHSPSLARFLPSRARLPGTTSHKILPHLTPNSPSPHPHPISRTSPLSPLAQTYRARSRKSS